MTSTRFWVVDLEGSGSRPPEIVEIAMLELVELVPRARHHWLVRPAGGIDPAASRIHGITDADLEGAPALEDIAPDICDHLNGVPIIGHNVRVEVDVLSRSLPEWKPESAIDTLRLAKLLLPGKASYALSNLGAELGLDVEARRLTDKGSHSALFDTTLTALLFIDMVKPLPTERRHQVLQSCDILYKPQGSLF